MTGIAHARNVVAVLERARNGQTPVQ